MPASPELAPTAVSSAVLASDDLSDRLRVVVGAALELAGPHDRDMVLQRIVQSAASVTKARRATLGVHDGLGRLVTFVHHGFDHETPDTVGDIPKDANSLAVPILRAGHRNGNLYVSEKEDGAPFDEIDEALLVALAAFAAGAIDTTELVRAERALAVAEEQARARRALLGQVIAAQEAERARVSRDLHDDVGQALTSVLLGLRLLEDSLKTPNIDPTEAFSRLDTLRNLVTDGLRRARQLAFDLRPTVLDDIGLVAALHRLREDLTTRTGRTIEFDTVALPIHPRLPNDTETVIYRVVQEALANVVRHAGASAASVTLSLLDNQIRVFIEDDGVGFDPEQHLLRTHLGIHGMHERAELANGSLTITSRPGGGTVVLLQVPRG